MATGTAPGYEQRRTSDSGINRFLVTAGGKFIVAAVLVMCGWVISQTKASTINDIGLTQAQQQINENRSKIETKVSKDEFAQYVQQSMENQRAIRAELTEIRQALARAEDRSNRSRKE